MELKKTLFALHNIIAAAEGRSQLKELTPDERRVLVAIGGVIAGGTPVHISDVVRNRELGAPMTVAKRLRHLERHDWVEIRYAEGSRVRKEVRLTEKAQRNLNLVSWSLDAHLAAGG
ncbi:hypothetical protein STAQ_36770 [Allostella sp. ATCC 35155]|nr:hypothetical protein STAQ_36770 [Stella sp. ATCC 35155]